jgi:SNF2 family DNA or RNA helicase
LELITSHLIDAGFNCKLIYGATPIEQTTIREEETREKIRNEFVDPRSGLDILVANPAACGESISLHKTCFNAIYYDLSYNCAQYLQSLDRIHRVGGSEKKQANYHFLQYENTIDQDIKGNLEKKASKMEAIIGEDYGIYSLNMFEEDEEVEAYDRLFAIK